MCRYGTWGHSLGSAGLVVGLDLRDAFQPEWLYNSNKKSKSTSVTQLYSRYKI